MNKALLLLLVIGLFVLTTDAFLVNSPSKLTARRRSRWQWNQEQVKLSNDLDELTARLFE
uniref:Uncharacterized protein n=1 Tax=Ciona intestinalis TaxID=7719 RepID=F6TUP4_CIOIN